MKLLILLLSFAIAIWIFHKIWISKNVFDVTGNKRDKKYQYNLEIYYGDQIKNVTMHSDSYYSDPWTLLQIYQEGQPVKCKNVLTIRSPEEIWSCRVGAITCISMTVSKRGEEDERTTQTTTRNRKTAIRKNL